GDDDTRAAEMNLKALRLHEELKNRYPTRTDYAINYAGTSGNQGDLLQGQDNSAAVEWYSRAIDALAGVPAAAEGETCARSVRWNAHLGRAGACLKLNRPDDAAKDWRRMVELSEGRQHFNYVMYRPRALAYLGKHARATAEVETLAGLRLHP